MTAGSIVDMKELGVWEPLAVKSQTIKTAVESATLLLRIDDIVSGMSKREKPAPGQAKGPQTEDPDQVLPASCTMLAATMLLLHAFACVFDLHGPKAHKLRNGECKAKRGLLKGLCCPLISYTLMQIWSICKDAFQIGLLGKAS